MRSYTLDLLVQFVRAAGELGAGGIIRSRHQANPLFPMPRDHDFIFLSRVDTLLLAQQVGTGFLIENMPFAFLPDLSH
jgi:hypothetical protein